jgi:hypothetical protein
VWLDFFFFFFLWLEFYCVFSLLTAWVGVHEDLGCSSPHSTCFSS